MIINYNDEIHVMFCVFRSATPLAQLYTTSTMEHHHFDQCIMILSGQVGLRNIFKTCFMYYLLELKDT